MTRNIKICIHWNLDNHPDLDQKIKEKIERLAELYVFRMRKKHFTSGDLLYDDGNGLYLTGFWTFTY